MKKYIVMAGLSLVGIGSFAVFQNMVSNEYLEDKKLASKCVQSGADSLKYITSAKQNRISFGKIWVEDFRISEDDSETITRALDCTYKVIPYLLKDLESNSHSSSIGIYFQPGRTYELKQPITIRGYNITLWGQGSTLKATTPMPYLLGSSQASDVIHTPNGNPEFASQMKFASQPLNISNMILDGNGMAENTLLMTTWNALLRNLEVKNALYHGIVFIAGANMEEGKTAVNNMIIQSHIHSNGRNGIRLYDPQQNNLTDLHIKDSILMNNGHFGIYASTSAGYHFSRLEFRNNLRGSIRIDSAGHADIFDRISSHDSTFILFNQLLRGNLAPLVQDSYIRGEIVVGGNGQKNEKVEEKWESIVRNSYLCFRSHNNRYIGAMARIRMPEAHRACRVLSSDDVFSTTYPFVTSSERNGEPLIKTSKLNGSDSYLTEKIDLVNVKHCGQLLNGLARIQLARLTSDVCDESHYKLSRPFTFYGQPKASPIGVSSKWRAIHVEQYRLFGDSDDVLFEKIRNVIVKSLEKNSHFQINLQPGRIYKISQTISFDQEAYIWLLGHGAQIRALSPLNTLIEIGTKSNYDNKAFTLNNLRLHGEGVANTGIKINNKKVIVDGLIALGMNSSIVDLDFSLVTSSDTCSVISNMKIYSGQASGIKINKNPYCRIYLRDGYIYNFPEFGVVTNDLSHAFIDGIHFYSVKGASIKALSLSEESASKRQLRAIYSEDALAINLENAEGPLGIYGSVFKGMINISTSEIGQDKNCLESKSNTFFRNTSGFIINQNCVYKSSRDLIRSLNPFRLNKNKSGKVFIESNWFQCFSDYDNYSIDGFVNASTKDVFDGKFNVDQNSSHELFYKSGLSTGRRYRVCADKL
ncbi:MAG: hypothetical protein AB7I27_11820 [Bacteriovoracaceae bacterium]